MLQTIFFPALFSFLFTLIGTVLALRWFPRFHLMDRPEKYGLARNPIPYSGGLILFLSFLFSTLLFVELESKVIGLIFGALLITFVSFWDDRFNLSPWVRLSVQILIGALVTLFGLKIQLLSNPFGNPIFLDSIKFEMLGQEIWLFSMLFIIVWLVLMMNVTNWLDGIPALSSGVGIVASFAMFLLSIQGFHTVDQTTIIILSISLFFSLLAFVIFEFPPPKILMGDTGSMFLGFLLGMFAIFAGGKVATALLIMGFPVLDALWVILRRLLTGKSPLRGDYKHFHHRLLHVGLPQKAALFLNYGLCAVFAGIALIIHNTRGKFTALLVLFGIMIVTGSLVYLLEKNKN